MGLSFCVMSERPVVKVLILTADGHYLARKRGGWRLTSDRSEATVFDYPAPGFADEIRRVPDVLGSVFVLQPADSFKADEICDGCGRVVRSSSAFFDGKQFLCPECKKARNGDASAEHRDQQNGQVGHGANSFRR
jgi:hypothetical protein